MIIDVSNQGVALQQSDDFKRFHVSAAPGVDVDQQLRRAQWGSCAAGQEAMIAVSAIRLAVGCAGADWHDQLASMLAYATAKGWVSDDGSEIVAHVERTAD